MSPELNGELFRGLLLLGLLAATTATLRTGAPS
jgi:hypothetical protein